DSAAGYLIVRGSWKFRKMLIIGTIDDERQHRKSEIFPGRGKCGRISDEGSARRHPFGTARMPVQFAEFPLSTPRPGQDANCAFKGDEKDAVIPGDREIAIPQSE